ncbi:MAG TPA: Flp family type IVb pilin [Xanthobacteraceae bacterium]|nr:Flp family type IVb pilin [Xanthobacteraceae bacterium]
MSRTVRRLIADQSGATAIEYGLICALIALALMIVFDVGKSLIAALETLIPALS